MGETENKNTAVKESWFAGLKAEFKKIIWPTKESLARQTTAVVIVSVVAWSDNYTSGYNHPVRCEFSSEFIMEA